MSNLVAAAIAFVLLHRGISGSPLRGVLIERLGEKSFGVIFQVASIASLVWLGWSYSMATSPSALTMVWNANPLWKHIQVVMQPLAVFCIVAGALSPNPGTYKQESVAQQADIARGILRISRHPFLWGIALSALGHILTLPSVRNLWLFGTLLLVSVTGTFSIDAKRQRSMGPSWTAFAGKTSNIPFGAILDGRQAIHFRELGVRNVAIALLLSFGLAIAHGPLFEHHW